jgi:hypothetical protein
MPANEVKELSEVYLVKPLQHKDIEVKRLPHFSPAPKPGLW